MLFAEVSVGMSSLIAARLGRGLATLPAVSSYCTSLLVTWHSKSRSNISFHWHNPDEQMNLRLSYPDYWQDLCILQLLTTDDENALSGTPISNISDDRTRNGPATSEQDPSPIGSGDDLHIGQLDTITEGTDESHESILTATLDDDERCRPDYYLTPSTGAQDVVLVACYHEIMANMRSGLPADSFLSFEHDHVDLSQGTNISCLSAEAYGMHLATGDTF